MIRPLGALALLALPAALVAQEMSEAEMKASEAGWKARRAGRYLDAADTLRAVAFDAAGKPKDSYAWQQWREYDGVLRGEPVADAAPHRAAPARDADRLRRAEGRDALREIVARAARTRIVILNEDHGTPRSRAFALEVARALRPLGYTLLAAETFDNRADDAASAAAMDRIARDGFIRLDTGFYSGDPVFADFVRQSLRLGYRPIAYEATERPKPGAGRDASIALREQGEADYLIRRTLTAHPGAKLLVHVGFSHLAEEPLKDFDGPATRWMAARVKAATGIDPLTIDQATLGERASYGRTDAYDLVAAKARARSIVPFLDGKPLVIGQYEGAVDLQVVHPRSRQVGGRPDWLRGMGRHPVAVPRSLLPANGRRLVQAFIAGEPDDAVPVDQVVVEAGRPAPALMLPRDKVRYAMQDAKE